MTRMKFKLFRSTFLLMLCVLATLATREFEFYREVNLPEDSNLEQVLRYLESKNHHQRGMQHLDSPSYLRQRESQERERLRNLLIEMAKERAYKEFASNSMRQRKNSDHWDYMMERLYPSKMSPYLDYDLPPGYYPEERGMKESILDEQQKYRSLARAMENQEIFREMHNHDERPAFTYAFDKPDLSKDAEFAVRPNDPRYYQEGPFKEAVNEQRVEDEATTKTTTEETSTTIKPNPVVNTHDYSIFKHIKMNVMPEPHRRASDRDPIVVSVNRQDSNDIYFVAIVAGCSAATMFALVLISLTWCRIQRVAKAAADVEYPAYGVTGPNKDMSPSGDQRLAQSAQMYHFQHQKQQIIAMESRVSANRDPGSVSEAESDEENEEGDYTVYECPGLAPTTEMEVKNPLFHDDPTPATPGKPKSSHM